MVKRFGSFEKIKSCANYLLPIFLAGCFHSDKQGASSYTVFSLDNPEVIGKTNVGQEVYLGGFSGLSYLGRGKDRVYKFITVTDQGPKAKRIKKSKKRPFILPEYSPRVVFLSVDLNKNKMAVTKTVSLVTRSAASPITGVPSTIEEEEPVDLQGLRVAVDPNGLDPEGVTADVNGGFVLADEMLPSVVWINSKGELTERMSPSKKSSRQNDRMLPEEYSSRQPNRGFEGIARYKQKIFVALQSPLQRGRSRKVTRQSRSLRIAMIENRKLVAEYIYLLETANDDKIGGLELDSSGNLYALERGGSGDANSFRKIFRLDYSKATNTLQIKSSLREKLEDWSIEDFEANGVQPIRKEMAVDLVKIGLHENKVEGLAIVEDRYWAVVIDNDFGLTGKVYKSDGLIKRSKKVSKLVLIPMDLSK